MQGRLQTALALAIILAGLVVQPALACPADNGPAPGTIKQHFCGAWDSSPPGALGSALNDAHRWGAGWIRDFDGGAWGRGGILEGDGVNFAYVIAQPWWNTYAAPGVGGAAGPLGYPTGRAEFGGHINDGPRENKYMTLQGGVINSWSAGTFETHGAILARWNALGGTAGPVGRPLSDEGETARVPGRYSRFEGGNMIYNPRVNDTFHVYGGILSKYAELGFSEHPLGLPTSDRLVNGVRGNEYQTFDGGVINQYGGHAYETHGAILAKWNDLGGPNGPVGLPTSDEGETARVPGRYSKFEGGNIIYNPRVNETFHIYGGILNKYTELGFSEHALGLPTSDRRVNGVRGNEYQTFDGGVINQYGGRAYETHGAILDRWNAEGGANGALGLPTSDEGATATSPRGTAGRYERFEGAVINYVPTSNRTFVLRGAIGDKYGSLGYAASYLGLPTSDEFADPRGVRQNFEGGFILYRARLGAQTDREIAGSPGDDIAEADLTDDPAGGADDGPSGSPGGTPGGGSGGAPLPPPNPELTVAALGDSVTAGFGYDQAGRALRVDEVLACALLVGPGSVGCQSPLLVAYPAVYARTHEVGAWTNEAVSGATPEDWISGRLESQLDRIVGRKPDLVMMTLGANPLLRSFLAGKGTLCALNPIVRDWDLRTTNCIRNELERNATRSWLTAIYSRLLNDPEAHLIVFRYHRTVPALSVLRQRQAELLFRELDATLTSAVAGVPQTKRARIRLISPGDFTGHGCSAPIAERWVIQADDCIHPSVLGHEQFAKAVDKAYDDDVLPKPRLKTRPSGSRAIDVTVRADGPASAVVEAARVQGARSSKRRVKGRAPLFVRTVALGRRGRAKVHVKFSKAVARRIKRRRGRSLTIRLSVIDPGGNMAWLKRRVRLG